MGAWKKILTTDDISNNQIELLTALVYEDPTATLTVSFSQFEKGVSTPLTFTYLTTDGNDTFVSATLSGEDVGASGTEDATGLLSSVSKTYIANFTTEGDISKTKTSYARIPQYWGVSTSSSFSNDNASYDNLTTELTKVVQSSTTMGTHQTPLSMSPNQQYVYLLSNKSNATIYDQNGFPVHSPSNAGDFEKSTINVDLADGTSQTIYQYRTIEPKGPLTPAAFGWRIE